MRYIKKPVEVEARQITHENQIEIALWCNGICRYGEAVTIDTLEGRMSAQIGDWVIRGIKGEFYPCKPDIFEETYVLAPGQEESAFMALFEGKGG